MTKLTLEIYDDVVSVLSKISNINDAGVELEIPEGSVLFDNILNLKLLKKHAEKNGVTVHFLTQDEIGNTLIESMDEGISAFTSLGESEDVEVPQEYAPSATKRRFRLPAFNFKTNTKLGFVLKIAVFFLILGLLGSLIYKYANGGQPATARIFVNSQQLARSITIKVKADTESDASKKILRGTVVKTNVELTKEVETTGEKLVGDKSEGKAVIYNKTTEERDFKKGTILTRDNDSGDLNFVTKDTVTVPAAVPVDPNDPGSALTPGNVEVEIEAENIGADYNLDKDTALEVKGQKKAEFAAEISQETEGGKSEKVKIVSETDKAKLLEELAKETAEQATSSLKSKVSATQQYINGSMKTFIVKNTYSHEVATESDKLSLTQTTDVEGLTYMKQQLDNLLDELLKEFVPDGYEISDKEREINVEVLGNTDASVLSSTEADVQVTLKTYVVPAIDAEAIKKDLAGKTVEEAQKILGSISNIKTYEFNLSKGFLPFNRKVSKDLNEIEVSIERE